MSSSNVSGQFVFGGKNFNITMQTSSDQLTLSVEDRMIGEKWKSSFSPPYIEDLTKKTGNFKQFEVFVSMLETAIRKSSDSVSLDLLTYADLQELRQRKATSGLIANKTRNVKQQGNKKYLILVYSVEFDRIHYPLPLPYLGKPDVAHLQNMVRQLNEELSMLRHNQVTELPSHSSAKAAALEELKENYRDLVQEKKDLLSAYKALEKQSVTKKNGSKEVRILKTIIQNLELETLKQKNKYQRQLAKKTAECKHLESQVKDLSAKERSLHLRVKSLTNELNVYKKAGRQSVSSRMSNHSYQYRTSTRCGGDIRSNSRTSNNGRKSYVSFRDRSLSAGSYTKDYGRATRVNSRGRSSSSQSRNITERYSSTERPKSRTPTPNRFSRFNPTEYNEQRKKKLRESQERRERRVRSRLLDSSNDSNRGRPRFKKTTANSSRPPLGYARDSSNDYSSSHQRTSSSTRRNKKGSHALRWNQGGDVTDENYNSGAFTTLKNRKAIVSSSPKISRNCNTTGMDEIDARLDALQQYMREIDINSSH